MQYLSHREYIAQKCNSTHASACTDISLHKHLPHPGASSAARR